MVHVHLLINCASLTAYNSVLIRIQDPTLITRGVSEEYRFTGSIMYDTRGNRSAFLLPVSVGFSVTRVATEKLEKPLIVAVTDLLFSQNWIPGTAVAYTCATTAACYLA